ncbi:MAG: tRNA (5-methylaminomethyl-2-thiouridine)(34)-methyltransferase MnmD [Pseudomonadota bacterium]
MALADQTDGIDWRADVPVSVAHGDPFYSLSDGAAESLYVFLAGNDLPARLRDGFHIAELGFGTGLNLALVLAAWAGPGRIRYTSFEAAPLARDVIARALSAFPAVTTTGWVPAAVLDAPDLRLSLPHAEIRVITGDARDALPAWDGTADAWFLDGFSPARNPAMWEPALMAEVARHTGPGGTFATYTAAGAVRRALSAAGFEVERCAGFGRKRHMTRGVLR